MSMTITSLIPSFRSIIYHFCYMWNIHAKSYFLAIRSLKFWGNLCFSIAI